MRLRRPFTAMLLTLGCATSPAYADVPVKVIITELTQLGGIDPDDSIGDFYARVKIGDGDRQSNQPQCGDGGLGGIAFPFLLFRDFIKIPDCSGPTPWTFIDNVPDGNDPIAIEIAIWDNDSVTGDDQADLSDVAPDNNPLNLMIDRATGRWSGDLNWPDNCSRARNDLAQDHARVCIQVSLDSDGDGLLDVWERDGIYDEDGVLALDLPAFGADPLHKDLFVELDSMSGNLPHALTIEKTKAAFAAAPVDAGGRDNPDGLPGINIWIDTGGVFDPGAIEDGTGACDDGVDNGLDGLADFADPDCIAGDNFGGGQVLVNRDDISGLSENFYDVRAANFDPSRRYAFRYGLLSLPHRSTTTTGFADEETIPILARVTLKDESQEWLRDEWAGNYFVKIVSGTGMDQERKILENTSDQLFVEEWDTIPDDTSEYRIFGVGGVGERPGNDFVVFNNARNGELTASLMHEIGHTLNLQHGGFERHNCKPNYVSVMSYDFPNGVPNVAGPRIFDFSPPRHSGAMQGMLPLSPLNENDLDERLPLNEYDEENFFVFKCLTNDGEDTEEDSCIDDLDNDGDGLTDEDDPDCYASVNRLLSEPVDWDNSEPVCNGPAETATVVRNIDFGGISRACAAEANEELTEIEGYDDWSNIVLSFVENGDEAGAPSGDIPVEFPAEEHLRYAEQLESTDLSISKSGSPDPVEVGTDLVYTLTVRNDGNQPAFLVEVVDFLPDSVDYLNDAAECVEDPAGRLRCALGTMMTGDQQQIEMTVSTDDVCSNGVPQALYNVAAVSHGEDGLGADPDTTNNVAELTMLPVDTTPPMFETHSVSPDELWAPDHTMQQVTVTATATDQCDAAPVCRLASISSNEPANGRGDGNTSEDWMITGALTAELRAERSGRGGGRVYTLTTECSDTAGNVVSDTVTVTIARDQSPRD